MESKTTTQGITMPIEKKVWQDPTLVIIDSANVNGGPADAVVEVTAPSLTATHHS